MPDVVSENDISEVNTTVVSPDEITDIAEPAQKSLFLKDKGVSVSYDSSLSPDEVKDSVVRDIYEKDKYPVVPKEGRQGFIRGAASKFVAAYQDTASEFYKTLGMVQKIDPNYYIGKWIKGKLGLPQTPSLTEVGEEISAEAQKNRAAGEQDNAFAQAGTDIIGGLGGLPLAIPEYTLMGEATMASIGESFISKYLGSFAIGAGESATMKAAREGKNVLGVAEEGVVGAGMAQIWTGAKFATVLPITALSQADVWAKALSEGRIPTKEEQLRSASNAFWTSMTFAALPGLAKMARFDPEKSQLGYSYDTITKHIEDGNIDGVRQELTDLTKSPNVSQSNKQRIKDLLNEGFLKDENFRADSKEDFKTKMKNAGLSAASLVTRLKNWAVTGLNPTLPVEKRFGKEAVAKTLKTFFTPEAESFQFDNLKSAIFDEKWQEIEKFVDKLSDQDKTDLNLLVGEPEGNAKIIQDGAKERLLGKLKGDTKLLDAIREAYDYVFNYAKQANIDVNYFKDYFYGKYKNDQGQVDQFIDNWSSTEAYTKEKKIPTYADAVNAGLELRELNPFSNAKSELRAVAFRGAMLELREFALGEEGKDFALELQDEKNDPRLKTWKPIKDEAMKGMLFDPDVANLVNSLLSTNKVSSNKLSKGMRTGALISQRVKFIFSLFHLNNMVKSMISDQDKGLLSGQGYKNVAKSGSLQHLQNVYPEEYKAYTERGGGHGYSIESQAQKDYTKFVEGMARSGNIGKKIVGKTIKAANWLPAGPEMIKWMFDDFIPSIKFTKYLDEVKSFEHREGRKITDPEAMDIIKATQQIYGEMNERMYGRSSTVTSAMRLIFTAPGYGEGNFRTIFGAGREIGQKLTGKQSPTGLRNARFITSSLMTSLITATIGTRIMTGKWPAMPTDPDKFRDLFKMKTNMKDGNGDELYFDVLTYEKDYYSIFGNVATGIAYRKPGEIAKIPGDLGKRVSGAITPAFKIATDLGTIFAGGTVVDFRNRPIYRKSDSPVQKVAKLMNHELSIEAPISLSTFLTSKEKGIDFLKAYGSAVVGIRTTTSEFVKKVKEVRTDLYDMQDSTRDMQQDIDKLFNENPKKAVEKASKFNEQQAKKVEQYFSRAGIDIDFAKLPRAEQNKYMVTKGRQKAVGTGTSVEGMTKRPVRRPRRSLGPEATEFLREQTGQ